MINSADSFTRLLYGIVNANEISYAYDSFDQLTSEQVSGLYSKTLTRHYDAFGRNVGYSVDGDRKQSITYDAATGRIAESDGFAWEYLPGSHLKSSLTYPNEDVVSWTYEPHRDLLTTVTNATYSTYTYTNDLLGRRTSKNDEQYGYNVRDELISADEVSYNYDDIGNRTIAEGKTYTANNLNQYTAIDDFTPQYDADGNQTLIKTGTGIWSVIYNAENRPIRWTQGAKVITMAFDRLGRRVSYREMNGTTQVAHAVFLYNGYLCIQQLFSDSPWNVYKEFIWDPTEPVATRPLCFRQYGKTATFLMHEGNKNVTDVVTVGPANTPVAHYDYAPFGAATHTGPRALDNPFRFSSEFADDTLGLVYYNYRHYNPTDGRWMRRDLMGEDVSFQLYSFLTNTPFGTDILGLARMLSGALIGTGSSVGSGKEVALEIWDLLNKLKEKRDAKGRVCFEIEIRDLVVLGSTSVRAETQCNADNTFVIAHGGITVNGKTWEDREFVWEKHKKDVVIEGFDICHDGNLTDIREFGDIKDKNVFGCYMSPSVRKRKSGRWFWEEHTSSRDTYGRMYRELYDILEEKYGSRLYCPCPIKIVIYEGERDNKTSTHSTESVKKRYPERF